MTDGSGADDRDPRQVARDCIEAGIAAAHPERVVRDAVARDGDVVTIGDERHDLTEHDSVIVLGGGNAAGHVAAAIEAVLGDAVDGGVVVTDDPVETAGVDVLPADHPVPSERSVESTAALLDRARDLDGETLVVAVVTGGGSACLAAPAGDVSLSALRTVTDGLLESGAAIDEINAVRKHLSAVKGGRLARLLAPARTTALVLSDVVGDDRSVVASGPLVPDPSTYADARDVLDEYDIDAPASVRERLRRGAAGDLAETPDAGDAAFDRVSTHVVANNMTAVRAAREVATERGYEPLVLSSRIRGEASEAALAHVAIAEEVRATGHPVEPPAVLLSGGETTVTVEGDGRGGPNQEFALAAAMELPPGTVLAAVDTDGIDGNTDAAGAVVDGETVADRDAARAALADDDAYPFLDDRGAVVETGPTGTNVNDLRVVVIPAGE